MLPSSSSLYLGNPMDPPDVLGMEPGIARPTQLPNRAKSTPVLFLSLVLFFFYRVWNILLNTNCFSLQNNLHHVHHNLLSCSRVRLSRVPAHKVALCSSMLLSDVCHPCLEPLYDSVMDDYDDSDDLASSSGAKRSGALLGLKLRPWEASGVRLAKSEVSLIDFTDDSFSSTTPSPLTDPQQDTLKVSMSAIPMFTTRGPQRMISSLQRNHPF